MFLLEALLIAATSASGGQSFLCRYASTHSSNVMLDLLGENHPPSTEPQMYDTGIRDRATFRDPSLPHQVFHHVTQCGRPHPQRGCGIHKVSLGMSTQHKQDASLERRHMDRLQAFSELAVQLQHQFQECHFLTAHVFDTAHGQCVVPFGSR